MAMIRGLNTGNISILLEGTLAYQNLLLLIRAELRRPKGPSSGAPYLYGKEKEAHELIFSWLSRQAVLLVGAYARRRPKRGRATWWPYSK